MKICSDIIIIVIIIIIIIIIDQGCNDIGVVIATKWCHYLF